MPSTISFAGLLLTLTLVVSGWECKDKSPDCPQWKQNMGGDCKGQDYQYMLQHCPQTCDICTEAEEAWKKAEEERLKNPTTEPEDSKVVVLDADTIDDFVNEYPLILLEFFAPWCGHCQHVAPNFREAAAELTKISEAGQLPTPVKLAKFDDSAPENRDYQAGSEEMWNFTSYPSMYIVQDGEVDDYWGGHETEEIVFHMSEVAKGKNQTEARIAYHDIEKRMKPGFYKDGGKHATPHIQELDPDNFAEMVLQSEAVWIVEFYSDKCPICNSLAPEFTKAAEKLQGEEPANKIRYGAVNSRVFDELAEAFEIKSYPWVASFVGGKKEEDMAGMGGWESFYNWGKNKLPLWTGNKVADAKIPDPPPKEEEKKDEL